MKLRALVLCLSCLATFSSSAGISDPYRLCPVSPGVEGAEELCRAAIETAETAGERRLLGKLLANLGFIYHRQKRYEEEISVLRRSLGQLVGPYDRHGPSTRLAKLLENAGDVAGAEAVLRCLLAEYEGLADESSTWMRGGVELHLADLYSKTGRGENAEALYRHSIEDLALGPGEGPAFPALVRLIQLYVRQNRISEAVEACHRWRAQLRAPAREGEEMCQQLGRTAP